MCRLLAFWSKQESLRHVMKDWIYSWLKSTKNDHYLHDVYGVPKKRCVHQDGWGVVTVGTDQDCIVNWEQKNLDLKPAFSYRKNSLTRSILAAPFLKSTNQIVLAHARRASVSMPVTFQQVQPLIIHNNKNALKVYLSHNGNVSSKVVNEVLDQEAQLNSREIREFSDTQILLWFIRQKLREMRINSENSVKKFWIPILKEIIEIHQDEHANYQMQLNILEIIDNKPQLIASSALGDESTPLMPYYRLFTGNREKIWVICSSTVVDYFKQDHKSSVWKFNEISNKSLVNLTFDGEFHSQQIS